MERKFQNCVFGRADSEVAILFVEGSPVPLHCQSFSCLRCFRLESTRHGDDTEMSESSVVTGSTPFDTKKVPSSAIGCCCAVSCCSKRSGIFLPCPFTAFRGTS